MTKHTQGPWVFNTSGVDSFYVTPQHHTLWTVAKTYTLADARLIAAAPDLLDALKIALEAPDDDKSWEDDAIAAIKAADPLWQTPWELRHPLK